MWIVSLIVLGSCSSFALAPNMIWNPQFCTNPLWIYFLKILHKSHLFFFTLNIFLMKDLSPHAINPIRCIIWIYNKHGMYIWSCVLKTTQKNTTFGVYFDSMYFDCEKIVVWNTHLFVALFVEYGKLTKLFWEKLVIDL